jgi:HEAT repeat protein
MAHAHSRTVRALLALTASAALVAGGVALHHHLRPARDASAQASASPASGWRQQWAPGFEYTFEFAWSGETHAILTEASAARVDVTYDVAGHLVAHAASVGGRTLLELHLEGLERHLLVAMGVAAVGTDDEARTQLETPRAWAVLDDAGTVASLLFAPDAPKAFRETMTKLIEQMQVTPAGDARSDWSAAEPGPNGRADAMYHADGLTLSRVRVRYESLSALSSGACASCAQHLADHADIALDPRGVVAKLDEQESLRLEQARRTIFDATNRFSLALLQVAKAHADADPIAQGADERKPGERAPLSGGDQRVVLEHEAAGFTPPALDAAIDLFASKGEHVADKTWLVHARAYLLLHPESVEALAKRLDAQGTSDAAVRGRNMVMQLLAVVGTPRAQEILRAALDDPREKSAPGYGLLVQKLGVVSHPTPETVAYVSDAYAHASAHAGERDLALADAATLGSLGGTLAKSDPAAARHIVARLDADLRGAGDPETRRGLLLALRNTNDVASVEADVIAATTDGSAEVRSEAARTLGADPSATARTTLQSLAADSDSVVAQEALQSLDRDAPTQADLHALATSVLSGQTTQSLDANVMDFFAGHMDDAGDASAVLQFILARTKNPALARRVRVLLAQLAS